MIIMFLFGMAMMGAMLYIPLFAQDVQGSTATNSGVIMMPMVFGLLISAIGSGQIIARTGHYKILAVIGMFGMTGAIFWMSTLNANSSSNDLAVRMMVAGLFMGVAMPIYNLIVQNAFPHDRLGVVTANTQLFRNLGSTVGVAIMGSIMNSELTSRIGDLSKNPFIHSLSQARPDLDLANIDINKLQGLLSPKVLGTIHSQIATQAAHLPAALRATFEAQATGGLNQFLELARTAISGSLSQVFLVSACVVSVSCVAVLFLKEVPLRKGAESVELAGTELAVELGDFAAEDEPELKVARKK